MEFNEKLQELRKRKGLTQEELAELLFVSRTAVSKWESGRGFPNIESLKAISKCFSVSLDELLSGEEILDIAEKDQKKKEGRFRDLVFGLLDCCMSLLLFLPLFGRSVGGTVSAVTLLKLSETKTYLLASYWSIVIVTVVLGTFILALQNISSVAWEKSKYKASLLIGSVGVGVFIISQQPYAATFSFVLLFIKCFSLIKHT